MKLHSFFCCYTICALLICLCRKQCSFMFHVLAYKCQLIDFNVHIKVYTTSSNIFNMIPGYSRDVTDVIKGNVLFFIKTSAFLV